jgi:AraC family transcriptional regulator
MQVQVRTLFGSSTMRIVDWRCTGHGPEPFGCEEWNDAPEVVLVRRGAFVRHSAGREVFLDAGTVAFHQPEESYRVRHPVGGDVCSAFRLTCASAAELMAPGEPEEFDDRPVRFPVPSAALDGRGFLLHRNALLATQDPTATPLEVEERAAAFLRAALAAGRGSSPENSSGTAPRRYRRAAEYVARAREVVARRYLEPVTLADIAREVGCSPFHLHRLVTGAVGVPMHRLVLRLRLRDALERLMETGDSVSAIAYATGFASHSHLTDAFRREYGRPPSAVRGLSARGLRPLRERARIR